MSGWDKMSSYCSKDSDRFGILRSDAGLIW